MQTTELRKRDEVGLFPSLNTMLGLLLAAQHSKGYITVVPLVQGASQAQISSEKRHVQANKQKIHKCFLFLGQIVKNKMNKR